MTVDLDVYLSGIVAGDPEAYAVWVAGAEPRLRASLRPFASHVDGEAVLQESLLRVWQVAPRFEPDGRANGLLRLALRIARNLALSELRRRRVRPSLVSALEAEQLAEPAVEPVDSDPLLRRVIAVCREKLPRKPAMALQARISGSFRPDHELASGLGMTLNTFLQNFTRARRLLAECLARHGVDLEAERA